MSDENAGVFGKIRKLVDFVPVGRELSFNAGADWALSGGYEYLVKNAPDKAKWLHDVVAKNPKFAWIPLWAIGEAIGRLSGKPTDHLWHARIADIITAFRNVTLVGHPDINDGSTGSLLSASTRSKDGMTVLDLQRRLSSIPTDLSSPIILRIHSMAPDRQRQVLRMVAHFDIDQITNLLQMDDHVLDALLGLSDQPPSTPPAVPSEDYKLKKLRELGEALKAKSEGRKE